jgi:hypothetical protein
MKKDFSEEFKKLIEQAHRAGTIKAWWDDGASVSNEAYHKSEDDLASAVKQFLEKYNENMV